MELYITQSQLPIECYASSRDLKPKPLEHKGIVQHFISAKNLSTVDAYKTEKIMQIFKDYKVSAHFLIDRNGAVLQLVPLQWQAWHAGESQFHGRKGCNKFMIGIENVGQYNVPFTDSQYDSNAKLSAWLMERYGFTQDWITGHEDVAPGRKVDPGPSWDWNKLHNLITYFKDDIKVYGVA